MRTEQKDLQEANGRNRPQFQIISPYIFIYLVDGVGRIAGFHEIQRKDCARETIILNVMDAAQRAGRLHLGSFLPIEVHLLQLCFGRLPGRRA